MNRKFTTLIFNKLKVVWVRLYQFFGKSTPKTPWRVFTGGHDCALVALVRVVPSLDTDKVAKAFQDCCAKWPYAGVTNSEFNVCLRRLDIFDRSHH